MYHVTLNGEPVADLNGIDEGYILRFGDREVRVQPVGDGGLEIEITKDGDFVTGD